MGDYLTTALSVSVLAGAIRIATPLLLAAIGEMVTERAGILNLGVEGIMTIGAFGAFVTVDQTGSLILGTLIGGLSGLVVGMVMAVLVVSIKVEQVVAGLAINLLGVGFSFYLLRAIFDDGSNDVPSVETFNIIAIPGLSAIPGIGEVLFTQHWLTYLAAFLVPVTWFVLNRTGFGLELQGVGHNPAAADLRGIHIERVQYLALAFGGFLAGLAGSFLSVFSTGLFFPTIAAGRGWIALAIVIFGNWRLGRIVAGAVFFGFLESFQLTQQALGSDLPQQLLLALPFVLTLVALVVNRSRSRVPMHLGVPYLRGQR